MWATSEREGAMAEDRRFELGVVTFFWGASFVAAIALVVVKCRAGDLDQSGAAPCYFILLTASTVIWYCYTKLRQVYWR
jgi:hypothetical protein